MSYVSEVLADNPVLYWRLGESSGTTAVDASGNGRDGTYNGAVTLGQPSLLAGDPANTAVDFDGSTGYVQVADTLDLTDFSVECWVKTTTTSAFLVNRWGGSGSGGINQLFCVLISGGLYFEVRANSGTSGVVSYSTATISNDAPHHVVCTYEASTGAMRIYMDGTQVATTTLSGGGPVTTTNTAFRAGARVSPSATFFEGIMDEVAYYTTVLSADRVLAHYNAGVTLPPPEITTTSLPSGTETIAYYAALTVDGEAGEWSITDGALPDGLSLDPDTGVITGTPTEAGVFCFDVTYTETVSELSDTVPLCITINAVPPAPVGTPTPCNCAADWRVEAIDLATGQRVTWLDPTTFNFEETLNQVGAGSITLPIRSASPSDVWPNLRAVVFSRIAGPGASPAAPVAEYIGIIRSASLQSGGTATLGLQSIEHYLSSRIIETDTTFTGEEQTIIGADLVNLATSDGVQLAGVSETSAITRDRTYLGADDKVILEAIQQLTEVIDGPDYTRVHTLTGGVWSTELVFTDYAGETTPRPINARRGLTAYSIEVGTETHTNWVRGRGDEIVYEDDTLGATIYPRFDRAIQWSDVSMSATLEDNVEGVLANFPDPTAVPEITIADLELAVMFQLGDHVTLNIDHGMIRYQGEARLVGKSWSLGPEQPTLCTFSFVPIDTASNAILDAPQGTGTGCC